MFTFAIHIARTTTIRMGEVGFLLGAVAGVVLTLSAMTPLGRRAGQVLAGLALAAGSVLLFVALRWGSL